MTKAQGNSGFYRTWNGMSPWKTTLWILLAALSAPVATAFPAEDDPSPGAMALRFNKQNNAWSRLDLAVVEAQPVPEPETWAILGAGLALAGAPREVVHLAGLLDDPLEGAALLLCIGGAAGERLHGCYVGDRVLAKRDRLGGRCRLRLFPRFACW